MNDFSYLGTKIAHLRDIHGMSVEALAANLGIKAVTLKNLEAGKFFKPELLQDLLNYFGYRLTIESCAESNCVCAESQAHYSPELSLPGEESLALLSHYYQNIGNDFGESYRDKATALMQESGYFPGLYDSYFQGQKKCPFPPPENPKFTFIDLFAGIGGFRIAMQRQGGKCVFSSEWDKAAQNTYFTNYGEYPFGDITKQDNKNLIPQDFDVLCGGFPCQPFSTAGKKQGFENETQGTLFFDILQIIRERKPKVVFLENVRNIVTHDNGNTFRVIRESIEKEGYSFHYAIIDASSLVPQKRIRCYMVCIRGNGDFRFPEIKGPELPLKNALEDNVPASFTLSDAMWQGHQNRTRRNLERGTGFTAFTADIEKPAHTLVARYYKDGKECLIPQEGNNPRMLTPRECARLQGFPEEFELPASKAVAYKQMGNSVAVPVLTRIAEEIYRQILSK